MAAPQFYWNSSLSLLLVVEYDFFLLLVQLVRFLLRTIEIYIRKEWWARVYVAENRETKKKYIWYSDTYISVEY